MQVQRGQYGRHALGQHGFTCTGRANQYHVVATGGGNLQCPLNVLLPLYIGKIQVIEGQVVEEFLSGVDDNLLRLAGAFKKVHHFLQVLHPIYLDIVYYGRFAGVLLGQNDAFKLLLAGLYGNRQRTFDGLYAPIQRQLAHDNVLG